MKVDTNVRLLERFLLEAVRFVENSIPVNAITTSHAQNDSGIFKLSFRDEGYQSFGGTGVINQWLAKWRMSCWGWDMGRVINFTRPPKSSWT